MNAARDPRPQVFIADDDPDDLLLIQKAIQTAAQDCDPVMFSTGQDLLDALMNGSPPKLVLLDLNMPVLSGHQVLLALRQEHRISVPVAVLSTSSLSSDRDKALALGACKFLTKPSSVRTFAAELAEIFRELGMLQGDPPSP